ncbi:hypothetical protein BDZ89DRAFT_1076533 [Hymenopellis radicata]|nr:hypothetical protein BDZ89DRAFT_1076533 [Hymenopellis radicata]
MSLNECYLAYRSAGWVFIIGFSVAEVILTIRTWAVWHCHRILSITLPLFYVACWSANFTFMGIFLSSMRFGTPPIQNFQGCLVTADDPILSWYWILLMIYEGVMLLLMSVRAYSEFRDVHAPTPQLLAGILKDGILYYLYLFVLSVINVVVIRVLHHDYTNLFSFFERVIHTILTCRVIVNIRSQARKDVLVATDLVGDLSAVATGPIRFRSQPYSRDSEERGKDGAPL